MTELKHKATFETILKNYQPSEESQRYLAQTNLVLLLAPTAGGRNTVINQLLATGNYFYIISDTTRKPRLNNGVLEQNGREYWFRTEIEMLKDLRQGQFLEAEIIHGRQVSGINIRELKRAAQEGKIAINDVDLGGMRTIRRISPTTTGIVILPPTFKEWLRRINSRGEMALAELTDRLVTAIRIFEEAVNESSLCLVINTDLPETIATIDAIAHGQRLADSVNQRAKQVAQILCEQTRAYLAAVQP